MKFHRIYAIVLRCYYQIIHSYDRLGDLFYWPTIDLLIWGLTSVYIQSFSPKNSMVIMMIVTGLVFWSIIWTSHYEITINQLQDLWDRNLINIFASPLKFSEWLSAIMVVSIIRVLIGLVFTIILASLLYAYNIFIYGYYLIIYIALLIMTGWAFGFFLAGVILRFGTKAQMFGWSTLAIISPFSAIYYPLSILPQWAQKIALFLPSTYIFEGARELLYKGYFDLNKVIISFVINCIYLFIALIFVNISYKKVLQKGLIKVI